MRDHTIYILSFTGIELREDGPYLCFDCPACGGGPTVPLMEWKSKDVSPADVDDMSEEHYDDHKRTARAGEEPCTLPRTERPSPQQACFLTLGEALTIALSKVNQTVGMVETIH